MSSYPTTECSASLSATANPRSQEQSPLDLPAIDVLLDVVPGTPASVGDNAEEKHLHQLALQFGASPECRVDSSAATVPKTLSDRSAAPFLPEDPGRQQEDQEDSVSSGICGSVPVEVRRCTKKRTCHAIGHVIQELQ